MFIVGLSLLGCFLSLLKTGCDRRVCLRLDTATAPRYGLQAPVSRRPSRRVPKSAAKTQEHIINDSWRCLCRRPWAQGEASPFDMSQAIPRRNERTGMAGRFFITGDTHGDVDMGKLERDRWPGGSTLDAGLDINGFAPAPSTSQLRTTENGRRRTPSGHKHGHVLLD